VDRQGLHRAWLARPCELHISTDPPALMEIFRYEERGRRLVPCLVTGASSPWTGSLKPGSYLIKIQVPSGCVQLPLLLERGQDPRFVHLPLPPLGPEDCLVAAGPYAEGDEQAPEGLPERIRTLPTFVVRKFPMRVREYFDFLNGLIAEGRMEEAELHAPFSEFAGFGSPGGPCWQWEGGRMVPGKDERGLLLPEQPIMQIRWDDAVAATAWFAKQSGLPWRLPYEREWEKAARGVDGRRWPWGNYFLPVWAAVADFSSETPSRQVVDSFPVDESPYGMRGAAGNIREWCLDQYHRQEDADGKPVNLYPDLRMVRGGGYYNTAEYARVGARRADAPGHHRDSIGFRMFRPLADPG
ncbi:MAG TPA: SUMF1/EgtB/PvdO family nonheme iron enzyme, partial [Myxococcota bacterium]|nr:SUMF1/EgtB/PvdO family nonheme iron enzyme [Myxococcota bacterium]